MFIIRTFHGVNMNGTQLWLAVLLLQALLITVNCGKPHRRSMSTQQSLSKGGWRPVIGSSGLVFGYGTAPLHAPSYKFPVLDSFPSSARPLAARDATKLTSIAQSYRPTTLRTIPAAPSPAASQPISSYLNPFSLPTNGLTHYKYVQNYPVQSVVIRNPHDPYNARPVFGKPYPTKSPFAVKQQYQLSNQQLANLQGFQFQATGKPLDIFGKPVNGYAKPTDNKAQSGGTEIYKTEVFKLPDSDTAQQAVSQQVKTAQQSLVTPKIPVSPYPQYPYQEPILPPSILGSFGSFGLQSVKGRDPVFPTKTTFFPSPSTKQTLFNSFSFAPNFKTTPTFIATTPKLQTTSNQIHFGSTWNDFKSHAVTQAPKPANPVNPAKIDPNTNKGTFKPSPQDPFSKYSPNGDYKVSTYSPTVQPTTFSYHNYHDYNYPQQQQNAQVQQQQQQQQHQYQQQVQQSYYNINSQQPDNNNYNYEKKKQKIHAQDSIGLNQQTSQQYANPPSHHDIEGTQNSGPHRATYEVTETYENEEVTSSVPQSWPGTQDSYKSTEEVATQQEFETYSRPATPLPDVPEEPEYAIVTEAEKGYENSLGYDNQIESQSRRPLGDDFEPIGKHKLKDYYYRVSTPAYDDHSARRTKKPTESSRYSSTQEASTQYSSNKENNEADPLPTLPPNLHFKRPSPSTPETVDKDRLRKRTKIRRRRPPQGNNNGPRRTPSSTEASTDEAHTIRPRTRPTASKPNYTTPTTSAVDLTTSAIPTISPTIPTIIKKKLVNRRPYTTTTEKPETTTATHESSKLSQELNKDSPIMKISASSRPVYPKLPTTAFEYRTSETPDYSHKQDEKDTPTSDIAVNLSDSLKSTSNTGSEKTFSFHRDAKPVEAKLEPIIREIITTEAPNSNESNEVTTTARVETTSNAGKISRPRLKNKYGRPGGFSVKDYRNRLSSTTSTEKPDSQTPKVRFPNRRAPSSENKTNDSENATERKKFTPKEPRHKLNGSELNEQVEKEIHSIRPNRHRQNAETTEGPTQKISARIRNGSRRPKPTEETVSETTSPTVHKRPLRKKIKDAEVGESVQDISVTENTQDKNDMTSERAHSESAIMKIKSDKKHPEHHLEHLFEHSKRVSDLTLAASKDYNTPGMFKTVSASSRRIPNYFTIATDDPILPIEAFFPQINQKKES